MLFDETLYFRIIIKLNMWFTSVWIIRFMMSIIISHIHPGIMKTMMFVMSSSEILLVLSGSSSSHVHMRDINTSSQSIMNILYFPFDYSLRMTKFCDYFESGAVRSCVNLVDFEKC